MTCMPLQIQNQCMQAAVHDFPGSTYKYGPALLQLSNSLQYPNNYIYALSVSLLHSEKQEVKSKDSSLCI